MRENMILRNIGHGKRQQGMTLLEVMVAVMILGFGLLGLGVMQSKNIALNQSAYYRSIAADLGNDLADRIHAIRTPFLVDAGAEIMPSKPPDFSKCIQTGAGTVNCGAQVAARAGNEDLVRTEMIEWNSILREQLPNGTYTLTPADSSAAGNFRYTLAITWLDNRQDKDNPNTSFSVVIE